MADLIAYLFSTRYFDEPGDPERGKTIFVKKQCNLCHAKGAKEMRSIRLERSDLPYLHGPDDVESWTGDVGEDEESQSALAKDRWEGNGRPDGVSQSRNAISILKFEIERGEKMVSAEWLKKTELFENLEESHLNTILSSTVESFPEEKTIFRQGEEATHLYVLIEGTVNLTVKTQDQTDFMTSKIEKEGAAFGIPSLIEPFRYNVTATCLRPSTVLTIEADHLKKRMEEDPKMGMKIMKKLAFIYFNRLNALRSGVSSLLQALKSKNQSHP